MLHSTKGIVLRSVKYGDTSIVVSIYTELFGLQSYLVNGVRSERKLSIKANAYQASTLLDLIVYHTPNKNLQRIKEARLHYIYDYMQHQVVKNTIAIYACELIYKTISEPETNQMLYDFFETSFLYIDKAPEADLANFPILFTIQLAEKLGFAIEDSYSEEANVLDMMNGRYTTRQALQSAHFVDGENAKLISSFLDENKWQSIVLNQQKRKALLAIVIQYLSLHIPHMNELKSVDVLHEILS